MVLAVAAGRFCGIMSTSKKDFPIELIQKLISFGCFDRCPCGLDRPSLVLLFYFFFSFISWSCLFMTARWCSRNPGGKDSRGEETKEIRGWEGYKGVTIGRWRHNKGKDWGQMKNKHEKKRGGRQREARKSEMWAIHKQTSPRDLRPAHLLLFTSEEIDTVEERLLAPGQNHCSAKLETGRTVGKAQIKNAFPTWTQYTAAQILCWKPKTQQHYFMSSSTERPQRAQWLHGDSLQRPSLDDGVPPNTTHSNDIRCF